MNEIFPAHSPEKEPILVEVGDIARLLPEYENNHNIAVITAPNESGYFLGCLEVEPSVFRGTGTFKNEWVEEVTEKQRLSFEDVALVCAQAVSHLEYPPSELVASVRQTLMNADT